MPTLTTVCLPRLMHVERSCRRRHLTIERGKYEVDALAHPKTAGRHAVAIHALFVCDTLHVKSAEYR